MSLLQRLLTETAEARATFLTIPLIRRALAGDVSRTAYLAFLKEAHYHVAHTCPLLSLAAAKTNDPSYRNALFTYLGEEQGHDAWIRSDIAAIATTNDDAVLGPPRRPCRLMVAYAYYAIEWISPYALLGMIHVLEGMSTQLAARAAEALRESFGIHGEHGFSYLISHGALDIEHAAFFARLLEGIEDRSAADAIIDCAKMMYGLYGDIFRDLDHVAIGDGAHVARG
jgi:pyrroloquinoline quinone (PQQ) biosynthesis protein C